MKSNPRSLQLEKARAQQRRPNAAKNFKNSKKRIVSNREVVGKVMLGLWI